jgi:maleate isomerase
MPRDLVPNTRDMQSGRGARRLAGDGWRARVGVVLPSVNTAIEPWFNSMAPAGVTIHASRMYLPDEFSRSSVVEMDRTQGIRAVRDLVSCAVDVVAYCCTASSVVGGPHYDRKLIAEIEAVAGVPCTTMTQSILDGLRVLGAKSIVIGSPYAADMHAAEREFFTRSGLRVVASQGMGIADALLLAAPEPGEIYRFAKSIWVASADALVLTCANFRAHYAIEALEADLGCPVITSTQATLWRSLLLAGVAESGMRGGQLMKVEKHSIVSQLGTPP